MRPSSSIVRQAKRAISSHPLLRRERSHFEGHVGHGTVELWVVGGFSSRPKAEVMKDKECQQKQGRGTELLSV